MPQSTFALLMTGHGPEPIIIQIKESLRKSDSLDVEVAKIKAFEQDNQLTAVKRWAGTKFLELLSFPARFTEAQALAVIAKLQQSPAIEKVVAYSAFNLEFKSSDFAHEFGPNEVVPEGMKRGLMSDVILGEMPKVSEQVAQPHLPGRLIVRWKNEYVWKAQQTGFAAAMETFNASAATQVLSSIESSDTELEQVLTFDENSQTLFDVLSSYRACPWVLYAQPDYLVEGHSTIPNESMFPQYQFNGAQKIQCPSAWDITQGDQNVVIAVGDTGAKLTHPDFSPNLATGAYNFLTGSSNVTDDNGHGSSVASILGAKGNNGQYMAGVAWNTSLLILKVLDMNNSVPSGSTSGIASAIRYAYGHNPQATAINLSLGTSPRSSFDATLLAAAMDARAHNMAIIASAGNENINSDLPGNIESPANLPYDNVVAVGATNSSDQRAQFPDQLHPASNYGLYRVELGAPGLDMFGLWNIDYGPNDIRSYSFYSGTSQAAPFVTGTIALAKSAFPVETYRDLIDRVVMSTDDVSGLTGVFRTGGRLNAFKALQKRTIIRNLSTRAKVETGDRIVIGGFIIGGAGSGTLKIVIRGIGPSLPPLSVARLNNPKITLVNSAGTTIASNDDWGNLEPGQRNDLIANQIAPADPREAAMVPTLPPGAYTVFLESQDGQLGVGQFELYELSGNTSQEIRLLNVSTRAPVGTGDEVVIAGCILGDSNSVQRRRILADAKGPSLTSVPGRLANPTLEFRNMSGALVVPLNDQWRDLDGASTALEEKLAYNGVAPLNDNESAVWPTVSQGAYTAIMRGASNATGVGLIELYEY